MAPIQKRLGPGAGDGKLTKAEERAVGRVDRAVYAAYFRCVMCMGVCVLLCCRSKMQM